jgi:glycosyltransferase involved in cell wall biosynthesis
VVLVHRYFVPDTPPYAAILADLARHLAGNDFKVTVLTCRPSYNRAAVHDAAGRESWEDRVDIIRWRALDDRQSTGLKAVNLAWFCLHLAFTLPRLPDVRVVMAASSPPVLVAFACSVLARLRGARFVYHKQDIYPEVTAGLPGRLPPVALRIARAVDASTDRRADRVVVLSTDMAATVERRGVPPAQIRILNNFDPWAGDQCDSRARHAAANGTLNVVFAGNLGRFQGLETVFAAFGQLDGEPLHFHVLGSGPLHAELARLAREKDWQHVTVYGYRAPDQVAAVLATTADLGIVSLAPGVIRTAYPSKTMSYLSHATPLLALVEADSELARMVRTERIGVQAEPGDLQGLVDLLSDLAREPDRLNGASGRALDVYGRVFTPQARRAEWLALFEELAT